MLASPPSQLGRVTINHAPACALEMSSLIYISCSKARSTLFKHLTYCTTFARGLFSLVRGKDENRSYVSRSRKAPTFRQPRMMLQFLNLRTYAFMKCTILFNPARRSDRDLAFFLLVSKRCSNNECSDSYKTEACTNCGIQAGQQYQSPSCSCRTFLCVLS